MVGVEQIDFVVVGGGLAGLTAAGYLARSGASVVLFEKAKTLGGRAATQDENGFKLNLGPHALYAGSDGIGVLRELAVPFTGKHPSPNGAYGVYHGRKHALPGGPVSLLTTSLLGLKGKLEVARLLGSLPKLDASRANGTSVAEWLDSNVRDAAARALLQALFRVSTYTHAPTQQSAGTALRQLQLALSANVLYLDGGWQTLVDGLRQAATANGARLISGTRVVEVEMSGGTVAAVKTSDGERMATNAVVITGAPQDVANLVPQLQAPRQWVEGFVPVKAACLDLGLKRLPQPRATFALGIDQPFYLSVHSASARLAPNGNAMIHVAKYLPCGVDTDARTDRAELEGMLDLVQPGWRDEVITERFLPNMVVAHALVSTAMGGYSGRPTAKVPGADGLYVAGDWVGPRGSLADASLASAKQAAELALTNHRRLASAA